MKGFVFVILFGTSLIAMSGCGKSETSKFEVVDPSQLKMTEGSELNAETPELTSTKWTMVELMGEAVSSPDKEKPYTLWLQTEGRMSAFAGCNQIAGSYLITGMNHIEFGQMAMTKMMCPDISTESTFVKMLFQVDGYEVSENSLVLMQGDKPLAQFVARSIDA